MRRKISKMDGLRFSRCQVFMKRQKLFRWTKLTSIYDIEMFECRDCTSHSTSAALTHWGWVMHICVSKLTIICSENGLSPGRRQAIIWTNAGVLLNGTLGTKFDEIFIEIHTFSIKKMHLKNVVWKMVAICLGPNVLIKEQRRTNQMLGVSV